MFVPPMLRRSWDYRPKARGRVGGAGGEGEGCKQQQWITSIRADKQQHKSALITPAQDEASIETLHLSSRCSVRKRLQPSLADASIKHSSLIRTTWLPGEGALLCPHSSQLFLSILWKIFFFFLNFESCKLLCCQYKLVGRLGQRVKKRGV